MSSSLIILLSLAFADSTVDLSAFKQHIAEEEYRKALKLAENINDTLLNQTELINSNVLPDFWMYRGLAYWGHRKRDQAMKAWREGLRADIKLLKRAEQAGCFTTEQLDIIAALTQETTAQHEFRLDIPEQTGEILFFLDGRKIEAGGIAYNGRHLLQVQCPFDPFRSIWVDSIKGIQWLSYCPKGIGEESTSNGIPGIGELPPINFVMTPEASVAETEQASTSEDRGKVEIPQSEDQSSVEVDWNYKEADTVNVMVIPNNDFRDKAGISVMVSGGVILTGGLLTHLTIVRPRYLSIEAARQNPNEITRTEADRLSQDFNSARWMTVALLGTGAAITSTGVTLYFTGSYEGSSILGAHWLF